MEVTASGGRADGRGLSNKHRLVAAQPHHFEHEQSYLSAEPLSSERVALDLPNPVLAAVDLYRFYHAGGEETLALRGVSMSLDPGEVVAVTGPSGSGKSTLLACLAGLDDPDGGSVRIGTETMSRRPEADRAAIRSRMIGMLFQSGNLLDHLTVEQNLFMAQDLAGSHDKQRVAALLEQVGLTDRAGALPATLSGGEAARAGLALALANDPLVILADEPTGELDEVAAKRILDLLHFYAAEGAGVLIVSHDPLVAAAADREIHIFDGVVTS